jgi:formamidopyrimidine-DNA glycosylase
VPELPEVETIRRQLAGLVTGAVVDAAEAHPSAKFNEAPRAVGGRFTGVGRRGKYLLFGLDDGRELVAHLGMTGSFEVIAADAPPFRPTPYTRAWWRFTDGRTLAFHDVRRFGRLAVVPAGEYQGLPTLHAIGPEPLSEAFTAAGLRDAVNRSAARLKTQLLSQRPVAGVGNIYADESLWLSRVHPGARSITLPQAKRLRQAIVDVLTSAIDHGGTTLRDYRGVDGSEGDNQHHLACYGRYGLGCPRCSTVLVRVVWDGRSTTYCPACQRDSR